MTDPMLFILGMLVVLIAFYDFLRTTMSLSGLGFLSYGVTYGLWALCSRLVLLGERHFGISARGAIGPFVLTAIAGLWIGLHLLGYTIMFRSGPSLVGSTSGDPATVLQTAAFVGSVLSTLGASTVEVTGGWWDMLTVVAAMNGMIVLTLSVSFILNVLQTTLSARALATRYRALMSRDEDRTSLETLSRAAQLGPDLCQVVVRLTASPLPGIFVPTERDMDFPKVVTELCDRLDAQGLADRDDQLPEVDVAELRWAIGLLGRSLGPQDASEDFAAARNWASKHTISR